jgi:hypothetical protein
MSWNIDSLEVGGVAESSLAADAAEREAVTAYVRLRGMVGVVVDAMRRADAAARLEAALRLAA